MFEMATWLSIRFYRKNRTRFLKKTKKLKKVTLSL